MRKVIQPSAAHPDLRLSAGDPFRRSLMGRPFWARLLAVTAGLVLFWLTVAWAVAVP